MAPPAAPPTRRSLIVAVLVVLWTLRELVPIVARSADTDVPAAAVPAVTVLVSSPPCATPRQATSAGDGSPVVTPALPRRTLAPTPPPSTAMGIVKGKRLPQCFSLPPPLPAPDSSKRGQDFVAATTAAADRRPCLAPVVCQQGAAAQCSPAATPTDTPPRCGWGLPELDAAIAARSKTVIVEVGTNKQPETASIRHTVPGRYTVAVEPLRKEGRHLWSNAFATVLVSAAAAPSRGNISLSADGVATSLTDGAMTFGGSRFVAPVIPLVEVLERLVPPHVHGEMLIVDAQGFDVNVVQSAGAAQLARFDMVIVECEELWAAHPDRLVRTAPKCTDIARQIEHEITNGTMRFAGCMRNVGGFEYNCLYVNVNGDPRNGREASDIGKAFEAFLNADQWPPMPNPALIKAVLRNATPTAEAPTWLDDADITTWPPGLMQLAALMPIERALEVAYVMCPTLLIADRAHSRCVMKDAAGLQDMLVARNACLRWRGTCSDPRAPKVRRRVCNAQLSVDCPGV